MTVVRFNWYGQPEQPPVPAVVSARAVARDVVEIEFENPAIVREASRLIVAPAERHTPITWGGNAWDAANPTNYVFERPAGGFKDGPGEAVDLIATYAEEAPEYWSEATYDSTDYIVATRVWVHTDFHHTARADYGVTVSSLKCEPTGPAVPDDEDEADFIGFVASQVARSTLRFFDIIGDQARRDDREGTGDLEKFLVILQEIYERLIEDTDAFFWEMCDIDRMRPEFLDNLLYDLGNPFAGMFDLTTNQKRKLAALLVQMYREKGTCIGVINAVRFFTGVTLTQCVESWRGTWRLSDGSYPTPNPGTGGPFTLSDSGGAGSGAVCRLGPGSSAYINSFWVESPVALTQDQRDQITAIVEYMKPAHQHFMGIIEP